MLKFVKLFSHYFFKKFLLLRQSITPLPGLQLHTLEVALYCLTSHCVPIFFSLFFPPSVLYFIAYIEQFSRTLILFPGVSDLLFSSCTVFFITDIVFFCSNRFFFGICLSPLCWNVPPSLSLDLYFHFLSFKKYFAPKFDICIITGPFLFTVLSSWLWVIFSYSFTCLVIYLNIYWILGCYILEVFFFLSLNSAIFYFGNLL